MTYVILSAVCVLGTIFLILVQRWRGQAFSKKEIELLVVIELFGLLITGREFFENERNFSGILERPAFGDGAEDVEVQYVAGDYKGSLMIEISEETLTEDQVRELLNQAETEIDESLPGENVDLMHVRTDLVMKKSYASGLVKAEWNEDTEGYVTFQGELEERPEAEIETVLSVILDCQGTKELYEIPIHILPVEAGTFEAFLQGLQETLERTNESGEVYELPKRVNAQEVQWMLPMDNGGVLLGGLGIVAGIALIFSRKEEERRRKKQLEQKLQEEYPRILSMLSIYISSGITIRQAMRRMTMDYENRRKRGEKRREGMELIRQAVHEMESGTGEMTVYKRLGERSQNRKYRKLSMLLIQDLEKGTGMLASQLEQEFNEVYEEERNRLRAEGEKLSTKLLLPMMGLLGVVLILMIYPAMTGMGIS